MATCKDCKTYKNNCPGSPTRELPRIGCFKSTPEALEDRVPQGQAMATKFLCEEEGPERYGTVFGYGREKYYFERHEVKHIAEELISVIKKWENE